MATRSTGQLVGTSTGRAVFIRNKGLICAGLTTAVTRHFRLPNELVDPSLRRDRSIGCILDWGWCLLVLRKRLL